MAKHDDCSECQAGMKQAMQALIGWNCPIHGVDHIDVGQMVSALISLRAEKEQAEAERDALKGALVATINSVPHATWCPGRSTEAVCACWRSAVWAVLEEYPPSITAAMDELREAVNGQYDGVDPITHVREARDE